MKRIVIGTRGSDLALWQTNHIADCIRAAAPDIDVKDLPDDDQDESWKAKDRKTSGTETVEYGECHDRIRLVMNQKEWIITVKVPRGSEESRPTQDINQAFDDKDGDRSGLHLMLSYMDMAAKLARDKAKD